MANKDSKKKARRGYYLLTFIFLISHILFFLEEEVVHTEDKVGGLVLILIWLILAGLTISGRYWARWILALLTFEFGLLFLFAGFEIPSVKMKILGLFYLLYACFPILVISFKPISRINYENRKRIVIEPRSAHQLPKIWDRITAMVIDWLILINIFTICIQLNLLSADNTELLITLFIIFLFVYESLLTTFSGTIGQRIMAINVRKFNEPLEKLNLLQSFSRALSKYLLGLGVLGILVMYLNNERRSIHDLIASSVMLGKQ